MSEDAGIEPRTVAILALTARRSIHLASSHPRTIVMLDPKRKGIEEVQKNFLNCFIEVKQGNELFTVTRRVLHINYSIFFPTSDKQAVRDKKLGLICMELVKFPRNNEQ